MTFAKNPVSRRRFIGGGVAAITATSLSPGNCSFTGEQEKAILTGAKDLADSAKKAVDALKESKQYADLFASGSEYLQVANALNSTAVSKFGSATKAIAGFSNSMKTLSKASTALGALGAGLGIGIGVLETFGVFGPSADEITHRMLREISGKIDNLQTTMLNEFDDLKQWIDNKTNLSEARINLRASLLTLENLQTDVALYTNLYRHSEAEFAHPNKDANGNFQPDFGRIDEQEKSLMKFDEITIATAVRGIHDVVTGDGYTSNFIAATYNNKKRPGSVTEIGKIADKLLNMMMSGYHGWVLIKTIQQRRKNLVVPSGANYTSAEAEKLVKNTEHVSYRAINDFVANGSSKEKFGGFIDRVQQEFKKWTDLAVKNRTENVKVFLSNYIHPKPEGPNLTGAWAQPGNRVNFRTAQEFEAGMLNGQKIEPGDIEGEIGWKFRDLPQTLKEIYMCDWLVAVYAFRERDYEDGNFFEDASGYGYFGSNVIVMMGSDPELRIPLTEREGFLGSNEPTVSAGFPPLNNPLIQVKLKWTEITEEDPAPIKPHKVVKKTGPWNPQDPRVKAGEVPSWTRFFFNDATMTQISFGSMQAAARALHDHSHQTSNESGFAMLVSKLFTTPENFAGPRLIVAPAELETPCVYVGTTAPNRLVYHGGTSRFAIIYR